MADKRPTIAYVSMQEKILAHAPKTKIRRLVGQQSDRVYEALEWMKTSDHRFSLNPSASLI